MSFLIEDRDTQFFVPEILTMLDFDEPSWPIKEETVFYELKPRNQHSDTEAELKPKKRKRTTTPRLRNKAKIELLRREIDCLEAELETLQQSKRMASILVTSYKKSPVVPVWKGIASRQRREREQAMLRNEGLKRMLVEQQRLTLSFSGVLTEWTRLALPKPGLSGCV